MSEEKKGDWGFTIVLIVIGIIGVSLLFGIPYWMGLDDERIIVEGKIVNVEVIEIGKVWANRFDVIELTFDNGEKYKVKIESIGLYDSDTLMDFTVNSKFIVELFRSDSDSYWTIEMMYKVPDNLEEG